MIISFGSDLHIEKKNEDAVRLLMKQFPILTTDIEVNNYLVTVWHTIMN